MNSHESRIIFPKIDYKRSTELAKKFYLATVFENSPKLPKYKPTKFPTLPKVH